MHSFKGAFQSLTFKMHLKLNAEKMMFNEVEWVGVDALVRDDEGGVIWTCSKLLIADVMLL